MPIKNNLIGSVIETPSEIKAKAINWLSRIDVAKSDIEFDYLRTESWAEISFILKGRVYSFKSTKQKTFKHNLKAIEIFLHNRVINIERGIEEFDTAFKGYQQLEHKQDNALENNMFTNLSRKEIKGMMKIYHPDIPVTGDRVKFEQLKQALEGLE